MKDATSPFTCPSCGAALPLADVNVAADVALCRACGRSGAFLHNASVPAISDDELARPPKRVRLRREFGDALSVVVRPSRAALWFFIPFTLLWSGISMTAIYLVPLVRGEFEWQEGLFGLPFLIGTLFLLTMILYLLFGRTTITLMKGRVRVSTGLFGKGRVREMECAKGTQVSLQMSGYRVNNVPQQEIVLRSGSEELKFGAMLLPNEAKPYVAAVLKRAAGGRQA